MYLTDIKVCASLTMIIINYHRRIHSGDVSVRCFLRMGKEACALMTFWTCSRYSVRQPPETSRLYMLSRSMVSSLLWYLVINLRNVQPTDQLHRCILYTIDGIHPAIHTYVHTYMHTHTYIHTHTCFCTVYVRAKEWERESRSRERLKRV